LALERSEPQEPLFHDRDHAIIFLTITRDQSSEEQKERLREYFNKQEENWGSSGSQDVIFAVEYMPKDEIRDEKLLFCSFAHL
jgi:hypothetical protein